MIKDLLERHYGMECLKYERVFAGAGSDTYFITAAEGRFVLKFPSASEINHPEREPELCEYLTARGVRVSRFLSNRDGGFISEDEKGRLFHLQRFVEGRSYELNEAPDWLMIASARNLGRIHSALRGFSGLPTGIGADFFRYMTPERAAKSYTRSLERARAEGDEELEGELVYRAALVKRLPTARFDLGHLTLTATHGDYFISQLICGEGEINATIDWTSACVHPAVWELMRSYAYAARECARGRIDPCGLEAYTDAYREEYPLNACDLGCLKSLFFYQLAVCDYYGQYYASEAANRDIYLRQARFSTRLMMDYYG